MFTAEKTILIVEDDVSLQDNLQIYLETLHFRVLQAKNVDAATAILQRERPDLILLDLLLPEKYGTDLLELLQKDKSRIPVIVITNTDSADKREKCMQLGARDFIIKSNTSLQTLVQLIVKYCDGAGA